MTLIKKGVLTFALMATAAFSSATLSYSNIVAKVTFDGSTTYDLDVAMNGNSIDFTAGDYPMYVASANSAYSSGVVTISYDVHSENGINGLDLIFTGMTLGNGKVGYMETVKDANGSVLDTVSGIKGGNSAFVGSDFLDFGGSYNDYSVCKVFALGLVNGNTDLGRNPTASLASLGVIEQNAVPEPATLGAIGMGLIGILARRRRK
ncbi:MAG: motif [Fimbriimonadaceae bacterium]|nr:motif [Fimbriimonadaceae bacterium]